jgi:hypothetical protein
MQSWWSYARFSIRTKDNAFGELLGRRICTTVRGSSLGRYGDSWHSCSALHNAEKLGEYWEADRGYRHLCFCQPALMSVLSLGSSEALRTTSTSRA